MGLGTNHVTRTTAATFIPAIWSDEIAAAYKKSLVVANIVKKMNFKGKKGDTVHIPVPTRGAASLKAQALTSLRSFYTDDAGYSLAKQIDTDLVQLGRGANGGTAASARYTAAYIGSDGTTAYDYSANTNTGNAAALTDAAIRRTIQRLDDNDIPMDGRFFVIPPSSRNTLMGLARYTEQAFVGEAGGSNTIRNGEIGNLYGIPVFVSSNADSTSATAAFGTDSPSGTATGRVCLMGHRDAFILVEQMGVRSQTQYKQEYLGSLFTADTLYGISELRDYGAIALAVPS
jgi:hypothetical protein